MVELWMCLILFLLLNNLHYYSFLFVCAVPTGRDIFLIINVLSVYSTKNSDSFYHLF